jgi:uncharacterized protein
VIAALHFRAPRPSAMSTFCWLDLAASDVAAAKRFYAQAFGWTSGEVNANGGSFIRLQVNGQDVGSMYQLTRSQIKAGVPSHWIPYVRVDCADHAARHVGVCGATLVVAPFAVQGLARVALLQDPVGALFGIWEPLELGKGGRHHD